MRIDDEPIAIEVPFDRGGEIGEGEAGSSRLSRRGPRTLVLARTSGGVSACGEVNLWPLKTRA